MFFCHGIQKMRSDGLTRRPPVTLPSAKYEQIFQPLTKINASVHTQCKQLPALAYTCLHLPTLSVNQITTVCRHSADYSTHYLHYFPIDNQYTYDKECRVQTVLQKTVSVGFSPVSTHLHTRIFVSTTRTTRITRYGVSPSAHPHIYEHNARTH